MHALTPRTLLSLALLVSIAPTPQPAAFDVAARREVADTVASQIERFYVDADTGRLIATAVRAKRRAGAYDSVIDPLRFAAQLTADLRAVNGDLHLSVAYAPGDPAAALRAPTAFADRSQHYALGRADVLPGNVGYLAIDGFSVDPGAVDVLVGALRYLASTDALILDLRRNRGGSGQLVNVLVSHFTGPDTLASLVVAVRGARPTTRYTLASVPGPRRPDVPLYVLTSRATASAGEDAAFVLQNLKRATLVGDRTAGAGHNVRFVTSGHDFRTGISFSRVSDPRTGKEWERVGVQPDVRVDPATALDVAHGLAVRAMLARADSTRRASLTRVADAIAARVTPREVPAAALASYAGTYDGGRRVRVAGGRLVYQTSPAAMPDTLLALGDSTFLAPSLTRYTFGHDRAGAVELRVESVDGARAVFSRAIDGAP